MSDERELTFLDEDVLVPREIYADIIVVLLRALLFITSRKTMRAEDVTEHKQALDAMYDLVKDRANG